MELTAVEVAARQYNSTRLRGRRKQIRADFSSSQANMCDNFGFAGKSILHWAWRFTA
jgi:hypothetical protein